MSDPVADHIKEFMPKVPGIEALIIFARMKDEIYELTCSENVTADDLFQCGVFVSESLAEGPS